MGVNPINEKPHPSGFIPKDKQTSKERFVVRYEGIPSSIYQSNQRRKKIVSIRLIVMGRFQNKRRN